MERLTKFLISLLLIPILLLVAGILIVLIPLLPIAVLIEPKVLTIKGK